MKERLQNLWQTAKEKTEAISSKLSAKTKKILLALIVLVIAGSIGLALWLNHKPYGELFSGLTQEEASEIMGKLQEDGIAYKYNEDGTIFVPEEQAEQLKAQLVYEGYPDSGFTYSIFSENVGMTSTESEKDHYKLLSLQDRLGATIRQFPDIKDAKVTIALGKDKRYVLDDKNKTDATASVTVTTKDEEQIDRKGVKAIQRLVSKSIPGVEFGNVAVICNGQDVSVEEEDESQSLASKLKMELEQQVENRVKKKIHDVLLPIYGEGHFQISVKSTVDVNKKLRELVNYSPEDKERNTGVISAENAGWQINRDGEQQGGVPGTETNADIPVYTRINSDGTEDFIGSEGDIQYLVDRLKEQTEIRAGDITDLSVAVIIDGKNLGGVKRNQLTSLVAKAAGISEADQNEKIEIVTAPFYNSVPETNQDKQDKEGFKLTKAQMILISVLAAILLIGIIVLVVLLVLRKKKKKRLLAAELAEQEAAAKEKAKAREERMQTLAEAMASKQEESDLSIDLLNLRNERGMELKGKIREFSEDNPEISAQLLKKWLRGGGDDNG